MDRQWVKILAQASLEDGAWKLSNPAAAREHSRSTLQKIVGLLFHDTKDAVAVFNDSSRKEKKLSLFPIYAKSRETMSGFVLVLGRTQLQLAQADMSLEIHMSRLQGFQQNSRLLHQLDPHCDPFGGISWIMDQKSIMTEDMIVKQLLHDLCREAYAGEW
ncbi:MAG: hypothetical protein NTX25_19615 [Proteobacteria bacterium]|nr:hypothetical protein [Pseudomonadota bacterium]